MCSDRARRRRRQPWSPSCARWVRSRPGRPSVRLAVTTAIPCACASICEAIRPDSSRACRSGSIADLRLQVRQGRKRKCAYHPTAEPICSIRKLHCQPQAEIWLALYLDGEDYGEFTVSSENLHQGTCERLPCHR